METAIGVIAILLFFFSLVCLVLGLIQPKIFSRFYKKGINRKKTSLVFGSAFVISIILIIIFSAGTPSLADMKSPTNHKSLTVSGNTSYKNAAIKIYQNGEVAKEMKADGKGDFSTPLELKEGSNKIKASATNDKNKAKSCSEVEVIYDITPPDFSFDQPQSPTSSDKFTLKGKSEKNAQIVIYSADKEVKKTKVIKDTFEIKDIALNEGENKLTVKAVDEADNYSQSKEVTIVYNKPKEEAKKSETPSQTPTPKPATPTPKPATPTPPPAQTPAPAPKTETPPSETTSQRNAVRKAKDYLSYTAFSHDGLVDQLEYEQFSHADAVYGADNSGGNWNEQAAKKAQDYMGYSSFSRGSLIAQLEYDKFTREQAEYGANAVGL